jgi:predicted ATP-dependent endonuclease of OLD family
MDLNHVKFNGFKRFEKATLNTSGKIIALLGANEAGKSSILEALTFLNNDLKLNPDIHLTIDRGEEPQDEDIILEAAFVLEEEDKKAIKHLDKNNYVKWFYIKKQANGKRLFDIKPQMYRETEYCCQVINTMNRLTKDEVNIRFFENVSNKEKADDIMSQLQDYTKPYLDIPSSIHNQLKIYVNLISNYIKEKEQSGEDQSVEIEFMAELKECIDKLIEYQNQVNPTQAAIDILKEKVPSFLLFSQRDRDFKSSYNLSTQNIEKIEIALKNFLEVAGLEIEKINQIKDKPSQMKTLINKANNKIEKTYKDKWSQSNLKPVIEIKHPILRVFIENKESQAFEVAHRSDGLRQFIALINFLEKEHIEKPILLVDEAEIHLHYDAQAELIDIFTQQNIAKKIIYTTHSVGCLPEDLGTGVKLVSPTEREERSTIKNNFWHEDRRPGVLPILFGMGASQLAFMAIRKCVFVEGAVDMLLLPTLLRQANQIDYLGFQMVQGIAMTANANFGLLQNTAPKVAFLVDSDKEGEKYKKQLIEQGIEESRIIKLPKEDTVLEDYIHKDLYFKAIQEQLSIWNEEYIQNSLSLTDIPDTNRPEWLKKWCEQSNLKEPQKREIAYSLLDLAMGETQAQLIEGHLKDSFVELYNQIAQSLSLK